MRRFYNRNQSNISNIKHFTAAFFTSVIPTGHIHLTYFYFKTDKLLVKKCNYQKNYIKYARHFCLGISYLGPVLPCKIVPYYQHMHVSIEKQVESHQDIHPDMERRVRNAQNRAPCRNGVKFQHEDQNYCLITSCY